MKQPRASMTRRMALAAGGVFGAGRATAMKMFEALGLNFDKQGRVK